MNKLFAIMLLTLAALPAQADLRVFATVPEWAALAREIGGDKVQVYAATTAFQDPHRIEAKPSLLAQARQANLVVAAGADLEIGWLPLVLRDAGAGFCPLAQVDRQVRDTGRIKVVGRFVEQHQVGRRLQDGPQGKIVALAAGQAVETLIQTPGQPGWQAFRRGAGQGEQFARRNRQAEQGRHVLRLQGETQAGRQFETTGKTRRTTGKNGERRALADPVRSGQADHFASPDREIKRSGGRPFPAGHQALRVKQRIQRAAFSRRCSVSSNKPNKSFASGVPPTVYGNNTAGMPALPAIHWLGPSCW